MVEFNLISIAGIGGPAILIIDGDTSITDIMSNFTSTQTILKLSFFLIATNDFTASRGQLDVLVVRVARRGNFLVQGGIHHHYTHVKRDTEIIFVQGFDCIGCRTIHVIPWILERKLKFLFDACWGQLTTVEDLMHGFEVKGIPFTTFIFFFSL